MKKSDEGLRPRYVVDGTTVKDTHTGRYFVDFEHYAQEFNDLYEGKGYHTRPQPEGAGDVETADSILDEIIESISIYASAKNLNPDWAYDAVNDNRVSAEKHDNQIKALLTEKDERVKELEKELSEEQARARKDYKQFAEEVKAEREKVASLKKDYADLHDQAERECGILSDPPEKEEGE